MHVQDDSEPGRSRHHPLIRRGRFLEGHQFGHRRDPPRGTELQVVLVLDRAAGEAADGRAGAEDEVGGVDLDRVVGGADDMSILLKRLFRGTYARTVRTRSAWGTSGEFRPSGSQPVPINSAIGRDTLGAGMADAQLINWPRPVIAHYLTDPAP